MLQESDLGLLPDHCTSNISVQTRDVESTKLGRKSRKAIALDRKEQGLVVRTLRCRLKDKHANWLRSVAKDVNFVWNYVNDLGVQILKRESRFVSAFDLNKFTTGASKAGLCLHSQTVQAISEEFVAKRSAAKKIKLRWRCSNPVKSNYSLGWIPFKSAAIAYRNGQIRFMGQAISLWDSYGLRDFDLGSGSISEDARGRWYINITVVTKKKDKVNPTIAAQRGKDAIGIDLGLKDFAAISTGKPIEKQDIYRNAEKKLAKLQRAGKMKQVTKLHAWIKNRRKDFHHKLSTALVAEHGAIFVGNVNASTLAKTTMAKSVLDAGWSQFRTLLQYKCDDAGVWFDEVNEAYSTQDCSVCFHRSGPKGLKDLGIREWACKECGTHHNRDVNAARNILRRGLATLAVGIPVL